MSDKGHVSVREMTDNRDMNKNKDKRKVQANRGIVKHWIETKLMVVSVELVG